LTVELDWLKKPVAISEKLAVVMLG
jgi:hypothetical protein